MELDPPSWPPNDPALPAARQVADRHGPEVVLGKLVWELLPAVRSDKGDAVRRVISESNAHNVLVAGDDLGDLSAFDAALELKARGSAALRIAVDSAEAPPALINQADVVVNGPASALLSLRETPSLGLRPQPSARLLFLRITDINIMRGRRHRYHRTGSVAEAIVAHHPRSAASSAAASRARRPVIPSVQPKTILS